MKKIIIISFLLFIAKAQAEAFGNSAIHFPKGGVAFFDKPFLVHKKPWGLSHEWMIGTAFMQAVDYRWWWLVDTNFAMGNISVSGRPFITSFMGGAGARYNILLEDFRPHTGLMLHYLQFFGDSVARMPLDLGWPIFVGIKPFLGLEWLFASELSFLVELAYGLYININEPFRQVFYLQSALLIYF